MTSQSNTVSEAGDLEWRRVGPGWEKQLQVFFEALTDEDRRRFHPHAFDDASVTRICAHEGRDVYAVLTEGRSIVAYGILRGWDEGFEIPSLGIAIHPAVRGSGLARIVMGLLHATAKRRGAKRIRLKTYQDNVPALTLYRSLGYKFEGTAEGQLLGFLSIEP